MALTQRVFPVLVYQSLALNELGANCADTMEFIGFGLSINRLALNEIGGNCADTKVFSGFGQSIASNPPNTDWHRMNCAATKAFIVFFLIYK